MEDKSHTPEKPVPGKEYKIKGVLGKITVEHWFTGDDDIRITLSDPAGNSAYFVTNKNGAEEWAKALSSEKIDNPVSVSANRAVAEIATLNNKNRLVIAYDAYSPEHRTQAIFDKEQVLRIKKVLGVNN